MKFKCHYILQKSNSTLERSAQLPGTADNGNAGNVADYLSLWLWGQQGTLQPGLLIICVASICLLPIF